MPPEVTPVAAPAPVQTPEAAPQKMGKFKTSRLIVSESWSVLKQDKELVVFPIISALVALVAVAFLVIGYISFAPNTSGEFNRDQMSAVEYAFLFVYYIVVFFVANFFQSAMYVIINARFGGQNLSFMDGIRGAIQNSGKVFLWSLISATVGVILRIIADNSKAVGKIVTSLLGTAWNIMTYFSLISLVIGKTTVKGSFKESAAIIRKTWGEVLIVNVGVGLFFGLITFGVFLALLVFGAVLQQPLGFIILGIIFIMFLVTMIVISSTLDTIFKFALYEYGRSGTIVPGFTPDVVVNAFKKS